MPPTYPKLLPSFLAAAIAVSATSLHAVEPGEWQLVWSDEFEDEGIPNPQWWDWEEGFVRNDEAQYYTVKRAENSRLEDGHLVLEARKGDFEGHAYSSASLTTRRSASWTYGRVEVRAKIPMGRGVWPAIWMLGDNIGSVGWPACGEIDIMEYVGYQPTTIHGTVHTTAYNHAIGTDRGKAIEIQDLDTAFHVYAIEWTEDKIDFFVDDQKYLTFENDGLGNDATWPFHRSQHLKLNLAIGGSWGGQQGIDDSIFPSQYLIDYVRVYQRKAAPPYSVSMNVSGPGSVAVTPLKDAYEDGETITLRAEPQIGKRLGKWKNFQPKRALTVTATVNRDLPLSVDFVDPVSMNANGDFSAGLEGWYSWASETAVAQYSASGDTAKIDITQAGSEAWEVQFGQGGLPLENGKRYRLGFEAWSLGGEHDIVATLAMNHQPYDAFATETITLGNEPQAFAVDHTHNSTTDPNARIEFDLSTRTGSVFFRNVSLVNLDEEPLRPYEAWKRNLEILPSADAADNDGDGAANLLEYYFQTDPFEKNVLPSLALFRSERGGIELEPTESPLPASALEEFEVTSHWSTDLLTWHHSLKTQAPSQADMVFKRLSFAAAPAIAD